MRTGLPAAESLLLRWLVRGPGAEAVLGDIEELHRHDVECLGPRIARRRLRKQLIESALAWWWPSSVMARWRATEAIDPGMSGHGRMSGRGTKTKTGGMGDMRGWLNDARIATRSLIGRPGFSLGVALTLGLGIGATTTIFSVVDGVLLRPLPYEAPGELAAVGAVFPSRPWADEEAGLLHLAGISMLNFEDYRERNRSFESLAGFELSSILIPDMGDGPELATAAAVSTELFEVLRVSPVLGRTFVPNEHSVDAEAVFMITHGAWQRRYGGDSDIVGRPLDRVGTPATIVGVLPPDFAPPEAFVSNTPDFWMPLKPDHPRYENRGARSLYLVGRLRQSVSVEQARVDATEIADQLAVEFPDGNVNVDGSHLGIGVNGLHEETVGTTARTLRIFLGAAGLLLLLSAMNAATLLLARSLDRIRELSVRTALGAGRGRVVRLLLTEAGLLSVAGGVIGVGIAVAGVAAFLRYAPSSIPRTSAIAVDVRVLAAAVVVSLGAGMAAGLLPALKVTRGSLWEPLRGAGRGEVDGASGLRSTLVGGQVAVALVLLSGAALLFTSFVRIRAVEPGFEPEGLITMNVGLKRPDAPPGEEPWQAWDGVLDELRTVPGLEAVAGASNVPFQSPNWAPRILLPGDPPDLRRETTAGYAITPGYFEAVGTELIAGRDIERLDGPDAQPVAIVNEAFVRAHLDGVEPVGAVLLMSSRGTGETRVVGVVEDVVQGRAEEGARPAVYVPYTQTDWPWIQATVRTQLPSETILPELRAAVARFNAVVPPRDVRTMPDRMSATRTTPRFQTLLIGAFALVALLLAAVGLYGSLAHAVGRRRRELGVRVALGAARANVLGLVLRQGMVTSVLGLIVGLIGTYWSTRALAGFLYGVEPHDPTTLLLAAAVLLGVSALACLVPALRATTVHPVEVLRSD